MSEAEKLDARGLVCPLPILRAKKVLNGLPGGSILQITATDPGALRDFPVFCRQTGHELLSCDSSENGEILIRIRRADD